MKKSGRYSAAELRVVSQRELPRPKPPGNLSEPAKEVWRAIVGAFRSDWFQGAENILTAYCEMATSERQVAEMLAACGTDDERWPELARLHCTVAGSLCTLGTKLRLTPQSTHDKRNTKLVSLPGKRPWEDSAEPEPEPAA